MADFCVDNTQQVEFDEKVVCGLWQCEALRASQKGHSFPHICPGESRDKTGNLVVRKPLCSVQLIRTVFD